MSSALDFKQSFLQLIFTLSIFDSLCITFNIIIFSAPLISQNYRLQVVMAYYVIQLVARNIANFHAHHITYDDS